MPARLAGRASAKLARCELMGGRTKRFPSLPPDRRRTIMQTPLHRTSRGLGDPPWRAIRKSCLCYDGSREGRKALRHGANLALDLKAETHVLAVVDMRSRLRKARACSPTWPADDSKRRARDILQEGVDWLTERGVPAQGHFAFGHPIDEIANLANELKVDLVVVGHRCRSGLVALVDGRGQHAAARPRVVQHSGGRVSGWRIGRCCRGRGVCGETGQDGSQRVAIGGPIVGRDARKTRRTWRNGQGRKPARSGSRLHGAISAPVSQRFSQTPSPIQVDGHQLPRDQAATPEDRGITRVARAVLIRHHEGVEVPIAGRGLRRLRCFLTAGKPRSRNGW